MTRRVERDRAERSDRQDATQNDRAPRCDGEAIERGAISCTARASERSSDREMWTVSERSVTRRSRTREGGTHEGGTWSKRTNSERSRREARARDAGRPPAPKTTTARNSNGAAQQQRRRATETTARDGGDPAATTATRRRRDGVSGDDGDGDDGNATATTAHHRREAEQRRGELVDAAGLGGDRLAADRDRGGVDERDGRRREPGRPERAAARAVRARSGRTRTRETVVAVVGVSSRTRVLSRERGRVVPGDPCCCGGARGARSGHGFVSTAVVVAGDATDGGRRMPIGRRLRARGHARAHGPTRTSGRARALPRTTPRR